MLMIGVTSYEFARSNDEREREGILSASHRYDVKPARFALNQGSRKLYSGGVTCPGLICRAGLQHMVDTNGLRCYIHTEMDCCDTGDNPSLKVLMKS